MNPRRISQYLGLIGMLALACQRPTPARFPHLQHLTALDCGEPGKPACLDCASCHGQPQPASGNFSDPTQSACANCHDHPQRLLARSRLSEPGPGEAINFSHVRHLRDERIKGQCVRCHRGVASDAPDSPVSPSMATCLDCHQQDFDRGVCTGCHPSAELALLKPESFMRHDQNWLRRHGTEANRAENVCTQCHLESSCQDCHDLSQTLPVYARRPEAILSEMQHRPGFVNHHAIEARSQPDTCVECHSPASCDSCHVARGVSAGAAGAQNPHPPGWVGRDTRARDFHGRAARRDLLACAACHDQGPRTNCIECHRPGAPGGSPHPKHWRSSQSQGSPMCGYCHE